MTVADQQALDALVVANAIRMERARRKRQIAALSTMDGRERVSSWLHRTPQWATNMKIRDMLMAINRWKDVKADAALKRAGIPAAKTFGSLTERQRDSLADHLRSGL